MSASKFSKGSYSNRKASESMQINMQNSSTIEGSPGQLESLVDDFLQSDFSTDDLPVVHDNTSDCEECPGLPIRG